MATLRLVKTPDRVHAILQHLPNGSVVNPPSLDLNDEITVIGRDPTNDVELRHPGVSRIHARVRRQADGFYIEDLRTRNHTIVNGLHLELAPQKLEDGDQIEIVRYVFDFQS
jgi:pSer/pThr/pTyr-binding forkhead associated (FHA) protein